MIRKSVHKFTWLTVFFVMLSGVTFAQYNSEEELKEAANDFFETQKYTDALPLFGQLLSNYPKEIDYNFKYGTCLLIGSKDKEESIKYLKFATSKATVNPKAYYFLAKAYHFNYQFSAAKVYYNKFKTKASSNDLKDFDVERDLKMCKNGEQLIKSMTDIGVLSKQDIRTSDFFRTYDLKGIGGKIIVKPDEFKSKFDKKRNETSIIYLGEKREMAVFSSYGKQGEHGKDIYKVVRLPNGEWSEPSIFAPEINSDFDEDYPFLHPDGRTLYFASKGFNSMGGYDIFKSTLDLTTGKWTYPENVDFPINTPGDDILYISDIDNQLAYFASSRESKQGELTVYRVTVEPAPVENSIVKGFFLAESHPDMKDATITIRDVEKDRRYGVYKTHSVTGEYLLVFPSNGGKFKILVETTNDAPIHSAVIELPVLDGFRALKQELRLVGEGNDEKLVIKNLFDESDEFDINDPLFVENFIKKKASLDVNTTEEEVFNKTTTDVLAHETSSSDYADMTDEELVNSSNQLAEKLIKQTEESKKQVNAAYKKANESSKTAREIFTEAEQLYQEASETDNPEEKKDKLALADNKKLEAAEYVTQTIAALALAKNIENEVVERNSDLPKINSLNNKINGNINKMHRSEAETNYVALNKLSSATYHSTSVVDSEKKLNERKLAETKEQYTKARKKTIKFKNRENELESKIEKLENQLANTKKKKEQDEIKAQIEVLKIDLEDNEFALDKAIVIEDEAKKTYNKQKNKVRIASFIIDNIVENAVSTTDTDENKKLQLENDVAYFEKEELVDLYPEELENTPTEIVAYDLNEHKNEYKIVDDKGKIVDYNTQRSVEISKVDELKDENKKSQRIIEINESWIKDIDEEISIRKKQLEVELNHAKKTNLDQKIATLSALKQEKQNEINLQSQLLADNESTVNENKINTLADNSNNNNTTTTTNSTKTSTTSSTIEDVEIVNEDGTVKDYPTIYSAALENTSDDDTYQAYTDKAKIHKKWVAATEQEIEFKKKKLNEADESEKAAIENRIAILENDKIEQEEYVAIYEMQAESIVPNETLADNNSNEAIKNERNSDNSINYENELANVDDIEILNENGTVKDYPTIFRAALENTSDDDTYQAYTDKAKIHKKWVAATEQEIQLKKKELNEADESEKATIENRIAILENHKIEQEEYVAIYEMQAESLAPSNEMADNNNMSNELENTKDNLTNEAINEAETENLPTINETESTNPPISNEITDTQIDDESFNTSENTINETDSETNTTNLLTENNNETNVSNESSTNFENQNPIVENKIETTNDPTPVYELTADKLNAEEDAFSNLKYYEEFEYKSPSSKKNIENVSELKNEAKSLKDEADIKLNEASKTNKPIKKAELISESDVLVKQFEDKQTKIAEYYEQANRTEYQNNKNAISEQKKSSTDEYSNQSLMVEMYEEEANSYYTQAQQEREKAINAPNFTERESALQKAYELEMKAINKQLMAINQVASTSDTEDIYANTTDNSTEDINSSDISTNENSTKNESIANHSSNDDKITENKSIDIGHTTENIEVNESMDNNTNAFKNTNLKSTSPEISDDDIAIIQNLPPTEIIDIKNSEEYQEYVELKKENRRLIKEAEVEYAEAEVYEQEVADQKQLGNALQAMAAGSNDEADKQKKMRQIEKLNVMIAENENKSNELKTSASSKEQQANNVQQKSDAILINVDENKATQYTSIEKIETHDPELLAKVINSLPNNEIATLNNSTSNNDNISDTINENVEDDSNELDIDNQQDDVIAENTETTTSNKESNDIEDANLINNIDNVSTNNNTSNETNNTANNEVFEDNATSNYDTETNSTTETTFSSKQPDLATINNVPEKLEQSIFILNNNQAVYDESNPIPKIKKLPEGVVFKVQIGAFRNPIPQNHFKGFAPIMAEDAGNSITRYTAGLFKTFNMANEAKSSIRSIGYTDAFVVAFYNGERISITKARELIGGETIAENNFSINTTNAENSKNNNSTITNNSTNETITPTEKVIDGVSTDVRNISGVFYAVQVGVYSKPVTAGQLNNVSPLNSERLTNGLIRYTSGNFKTMNEANAAKDRIRNQGINDAFVVAYQNGSKITIAEASNSLSSEINNNVEMEKNEINKTNVTNIETTENMNNENIVNDDVKSYSGEDLNIEFKVKLGEYEEDVPVEDAAKFLQLTGRGVKNYEKDGKTIYVLGSFPDFQSALDTQIEMKEFGITHPETVAYKDGKDITVDEALELIKNK